MAAEDKYHDRFCYCEICHSNRLNAQHAQQREEEKRLVRQAEYLKRVTRLGQQGNPFTTFDLKTTQVKLVPVVLEAMNNWNYGNGDKFEETRLMVYKVIATRKFSKPQPDGSLLPIEQVVFSGEVVAADSSSACFIAGIGIKQTAEELSTTTVKVSQIA